MFRASTCPSSGGQIVLSQHLVLSLCKWLYSMLDHWHHILQYSHSSTDSLRQLLSWICKRLYCTAVLLESCVDIKWWWHFIYQTFFAYVTIVIIKQVLGNETTDICQWKHLHITCTYSSTHSTLCFFSNMNNVWNTVSGLTVMTCWWTG